MMTNPQVLIQTDYGDITLELNQEKAPVTVKNFLDYVASGHYDGTIFHRIIDGFMIQGGGFDESMTEKPTKDPIKNEANNGLSNDIGTVAMARTSEPHSASAQFFINVVTNSFLNFKSETEDGWGYTVFGKVISDMSVIDKIKAVATGVHGFHRDVPVNPIIVKSAQLVKETESMNAS